MHHNENFFRVLEKLLVPVFIGVLAFFTASSGNKISKQQTQWIEFQNARDAEDSKRQMELKYLELFYQDISSTDPRTLEITSRFVEESLGAQTIECRFSELNGSITVSLGPKSAGPAMGPAGRMQPAVQLRGVLVNPE